MATKSHSEYEKDFYAWTFHNADLLRHRKFSELDIDNIIEEMESMGKRDKRELVNRLAVLLAHLLKWQFQPDRRGNSWEATIREQRIQVIDLLEESPSLKHELELKIAHAYEQAILIAVSETGLASSIFPKEMPYSLNQCLDSKFFPD